MRRTLWHCARSWQRSTLEAAIRHALDGNCGRRIGIGINVGINYSARGPCWVLADTRDTHCIDCIVLKRTMYICSSPTIWVTGVGWGTKHSNVKPGDGMVLGLNALAGFSVCPQLVWRWTFSYMYVLSVPTRLAQRRAQRKRPGGPALEYHPVSAGVLASALNGQGKNAVAKRRATAALDIVAKSRLYFLCLSWRSWTQFRGLT